MKLSPIPSSKLKKYDTQVVDRRDGADRGKQTKQQKYEKLMRFDMQIDDQIQSMDSRLRRLEKLTSRDARSDTKKSNKIIKQVQFSQTRRSSLQDGD